jgi:MFS family permease
VIVLAGAYSPPQHELMRDWSVSETVYNLGITAYTAGFAIAPMLLGPFPEVIGRRPVFLASGLLFTGKIHLILHNSLRILMRI